MKSLESLKELLRDTLIKNDGDIKLSEHRDIINHAKELGFDDRKLSKLLQEVDATINWDYIQQQKEIVEPVKHSTKKQPRKVKRLPDDTKEIILPTPSLVSNKIITPVRVFIAIVIVLVLFAIIKESTKPVDDKGIAMYSYANALAFRSKPDLENDNIISMLNYGTEVKVSSNESEWAKCRIEDTKGYVASQFLLSKKDFHELESIFADTNARNMVSTARSRKAILNYFITYGIMGRLSAETQIEIYGGQVNKQMWQIFTEPKESRYNTVAYLKVVNPNSKFDDFACIIENVSTQQRRFLLFTFDETESPGLEYEEEAPRKGNIKAVRRLYKQNQPVYKVTYIN